MSVSNSLVCYYLAGVAYLTIGLGFYDAMVHPQTPLTFRPHIVKILTWPVSVPYHIYKFTSQD